MPECDFTPFVAAVLRSRDNLDILMEGSEKADQALHRIFPKIALEQPRHFRLADAHSLARCRLCQLFRAGKPVKLGNNLCFQQMMIGIREPQIGENVGLAGV